MKKHTVGIRGCAGMSNRRKFGTKRLPCAQPVVVTINGKGWCYYHRPDKPRKFGEGYK